MSYLECASAPLGDMTKGTISLWFRDISKGPDAPATPAAPGPSVGGHPPIGWPLAVAPDTIALVKQVNPPAVFFWNAYGVPIQDIGVISPFLGPAAVWSPIPPPIPTDHIRMLLTFGDPRQDYDYCPWRMQGVSVLDAVHYIPNTGTPYNTADFPPPYKPWFRNEGADGKYQVENMVLQGPQSYQGIVPQSFIGVDNDGYIIICLQTKSKATYKGYAFQLDETKELWADQSILVGTPPTGWAMVGPYWNGYEFTYKDVSNEIMGAQPESFVIGGPGAFLDISFGPRVERDGAGTWHHLLFSFDISGEVDCKLDEDEASGVRQFTVSTGCKAWLALDDKNYKGAQLQTRFAVPDGFLAPLLPGMGTDIQGYGPSTSASRNAFPIGPNDILPRSVWTLGFKHLPKFGLMWNFSTSGIAKEDMFPPNAPPILKGDFNPLPWAGVLWPLFHSLGGWLPVLDPPRPTTPDPKTLDSPTYFCESFVIPTAGHPIGIPASSHHIQHNTGLEMAELQIWADKVVDTSDVNIRRLFIDYPRDEKGKPIPGSHLKSVPPSKAAKVLGEPDILLHGSKNWKKGRNTGTTGVDPDGKIKAGGQFQPIAKIEKFEPDPELTK